MEKLPAIAGAILGGLAALACVGYITGAMTIGEIVSGAAVLAVIVFGLIIIGEG